MPYICMARNDIPEGTLQILDLYPNSSQYIPAYTPGTGQTKYVTRAQNVPTAISRAGTLDGASYADGLSAYLIDRVEPGGVEVASGILTAVGPHNGDHFHLAGVQFDCIENFATGTVQVVGVVSGTTFTLDATPLTCVQNQATGTITIQGTCAAGDTVNIAGITTASGGANGFLAVHAGPVAANGEFLDAQAPNTDITSADSLRTAITTCAALITAALDAIIPGVGGAINPNAAGTALITLTSSAPGAWGDAALVQVGGHITLSGAAMTHTNANAAAGEFNSTAHLYTNIAAATSLAAAINASAVAVSAATGGTDTATITADVRGLASQFGMVSSVPAELVRSGATMVAAAPVAASQQFAGILQAVGGTNAAVATTIQATVNDAASIVAMKAAAGGLYANSAAPVGAVLVFSAKDNAGVALKGASGNTIGFTVNNAVSLAQDATSASSGSLNRTHQQWTVPYQTAASAALIARLDAGSALTLTDINTVLSAQGGAELTTAGGSNSTGTVVDVLEILSGRGYRINRYAATGTANQYMDAAHPTYLWNATTLGSFTSATTVYGTHWIDGEIRPAAIGGDTENREIRGVRHTYDTTGFQVSLLNGVLNKLSGPMVLWPSSDQNPVFDWSMQHMDRFTQTNVQRLVTVYDDSGNVLA
jgi:hypothetical protein